MSLPSCGTGATALSERLNPGSHSVSDPSGLSRSTVPNAPPQGRTYPQQLSSVISPDDIERLISPERFTTYVDLCDGNRVQAAQLYEWSGEIAGALFTDFRTLEVVFRNRVDQALTDYVAAVSPDVENWMWDPSWIPPGGHWWDQNAIQALRRAQRQAGGKTATHGAIIAALTFGFWRYIVSGRYEEAFWNTALDSAFAAIPGHAPGDRRHGLEQAMINLHALRNRLAHHEAIPKPWARRVPGGQMRVFTIDDLYSDVVQVLRWTTPSLADLLLNRSLVPVLLQRRPS